MSFEFTTFFAGCLDLVLEARCAFCSAPTTLDEPFFCAAHRLAPDRFVTRSHACATCGMPWPREHDLCTPCATKPRLFAEYAAAYAFEGMARRALLDAKLARRRALLQPLSQGLVERLALHRWAHGATWVPVPLHRRRQRRRGFNQSALVAEYLVEGLGGVVRPILRRTRATQPQGQVATSRREENLRGAFALRRGARMRRGVHVIVDDVATSLTTLREAARTLRRAGCTKLYAATLCRTLPPSWRGWRGGDDERPSEQPHELGHDLVVHREDEIA